MTNTERTDLIDAISDISKEVDGVRFRADFLGMSDKVLWETYTYFTRQMCDMSANYRGIDMTKRIHEYEYTSGLEVQHDEERDEYLVPDIFDDSIRHVTRTFDEACAVCDTLYKELDDLIKL